MHGLDGPAKARSESQRSVHLPVAWAWLRSPADGTRATAGRPSIARMPAHRSPAPRARLLPVLVLGLALSACSPAGGASEDARSAGGVVSGKDGGSCVLGRLATVTPARLTLSTGASTQAPWVVGGDGAARAGDPKAGKGYDAAVGLDLAGRLGFRQEDVTWVRTPFPQAIAAGEKEFDVHVGQATITDERRAGVDLSAPYYVMRQAVVSLTGRPTAGVTDLAGLRRVRLAVLKGSPGERAVDEVVRPDSPPARYDDLDQARRALGDGTQDALVVDVQTALTLDRDDTQLVDGELIGQLRRADPAETYGLVLEKGSPLTRCVDAALSSMREDGTLDRLERQWLTDGPGWPELT